MLDHDIINMNGRIYDPITAQFMQADNYIQTPEDFVGYNHYSYCRNNPFKYTDPSGESLKLEFDNSSSYSGPGLALLAQIQAYQNALADAFLAWYQDTSQDHNSSFFATNYGGGGGGGTGTASDAGSSGQGDNSSQHEYGGPYAQHKLKRDKNGNYIIPDGATVSNVNNNGEPVYYKPEKGEYDASYTVDEGYYITGAVDGIATSYSKDEVFKIPDNVDVVVNDGGMVHWDFNSGYLFLMFCKQAIETLKGNPYRVGWLNADYFIGIDAYNYGWNQLFDYTKR